MKYHLAGAESKGEDREGEGEKKGLHLRHQTFLGTLQAAIFVGRDFTTAFASHRSNAILAASSRTLSHEPLP
jgi:hypothetical protein